MFTYRPQKHQGQRQCPDDYGSNTEECRYGSWFGHVLPADVSGFWSPSCQETVAIGGQKELNCLVSGRTIMKCDKANSAGEWLELVAVDQRFELLVQSVQFCAVQNVIESTSSPPRMLMLLGTIVLLCRGRYSTFTLHLPRHRRGRCQRHADCRKAGLWHRSDSCTPRRAP